MKFKIFVLFCVVALSSTACDKSNVKKQTEAPIHPTAAQVDVEPA